MGMRGPVTQESLDAQRRAEWLRDWIENKKLSWTVGLFSGKQRWEMLTYDAGINEHGQLVIRDRQFEMEVQLYAKAGVDWHYLIITYWDGVEWREFRPSFEYQNHLAEQEAEKVQPGGCFYAWCSKPEGHDLPHKRKDGKRILGDVPQA